MVDTQPTLLSVIDKRLNRRFGALAKALPGNVVAYDSVTETATVRPGVYRLVPSSTNNELDETEQVPDLFHVPVAWPRAQGFSLVGSLEAGDPVLLVAMDRDIGGWRRTNKLSEPDDARDHRWASVVAVPGLQADVGGFAPPGDAAALASRLDDIGRVIALLPDPTTLPSVLTAVVGILEAFRLLYLSSPPQAVPPSNTCASAILKLEE